MTQSNLSIGLRLFKALGDETRLRMLHLLAENELSASELVRILNVHQSNISRHLNHLKDSSLVQDRREGTLTWFRWSRELKGDHSVAPILRQAFAEIPESTEDLQKVQQIIEERKNEGRKFFDQIAGRYKDIAKPGGGFEALLEAFLSLNSFGHVVDLGCGEGELSLILAKYAQHVTAVDLSPSMLDVLNNKAQRLKLTNIQTQLGDIEAIPLNDASMDLVILSQALHHSSRPEKVIAEMSRVLKPGGKALILDLLLHEQEWVREKMGDYWLGFEVEEVVSWLHDHNLILNFKQNIEPEQGLPVFVLSITKP